MKRVAFFLAAAATLAPAQTGPAFDVASLKPSPPVGLGENYSANLGSTHHGELTMTNCTLVDCIKFAYGLVSDDQMAGPDWTKSKEVRFDVLGKAAAATPREQLLLMLRTLLAERFHLVMHTEQRRIPHYALVAAKNGPKIERVPCEPPAAGMSYRIGHIVHPQCSTYALALLLSRQLHEMVLDETGLKGCYKIDLEWTPDLPQPGGSAVETDTRGPSLFSAVQEQLGLKLEGRKDEVEVRVIDHADRVPVGN